MQIAHRTEIKIFWGLVAFLFVFIPLASVVANPIEEFYGVRSSFLTAEKAHPRIFDWRNKYGTSLMSISELFC